MLARDQILVYLDWTAHWTSPIALCDLQQVVLFWFFINIFLVKLQARVIHSRVQMFQQIWMRHLRVWIPSWLWLLWIAKFEASTSWMWNMIALFQQKSFSVFRCLKTLSFQMLEDTQSCLVMFSSPIQSMRVFCVCCMNFQHRGAPPATAGKMSYAEVKRPSAGLCSVFYWRMDQCY